MSFTVPPSSSSMDLVSIRFSKNNCEDFAVYCKTGLLVFTNTSVGLSGQAVALFAIASAIISSPLRFLTTGFTGLATKPEELFSSSRPSLFGCSGAVEEGTSNLMTGARVTIGMGHA
ncbi:hypothetical protein CK203_042664 [Vitis vinifera]|uniref:LRAT domain-containing protein n=1 Tax=Vitis vinifera TaxID=29760 RepID=A0A438I768_VITVI|nr:hypothetical protein CK203_042664 [Vitis vinifera]